MFKLEALNNMLKDLGTAVSLVSFSHGSKVVPPPFLQYAP